jgi:hypothetical protein
VGDVKQKIFSAICAPAQRVHYLVTRLLMITVKGVKGERNVNATTMLPDMLPELLRTLESELGHYYEEHGQCYNYVKQKSKLRADHTQANKENDINHLDFILPAGNEMMFREYSQFISRECRIRGISLNGILEDW